MKEFKYNLKDYYPTKRSLAGTGGGNAKYWLAPKIACDYSKGFTTREIGQIEEIIEANY